MKEPFFSKQNFLIRNDLCDVHYGEVNGLDGAYCMMRRLANRLNDNEYFTFAMVGHKYINYKNNGIVYNIEKGLPNKISILNINIQE